MEKIPKTVDLFDISHTLAKSLFKSEEYPHAVIPKLSGYIIKLFERLGDSFMEIRDGVFVAKDAIISHGATILGPTVIGHGAEVRPGAYIRGSVIVGDGAVIGNSSEVKNSVIFDGAKLPHYNYAGDSVIGYMAHLGAGAIASNLRLDKRSVRICCGEEILDTGLSKLGVLLGDYCEVGCGSVLSPGAIIGRESIIYPLSSVRGVLPEGCVYDGGIREARGR